MVYGLGGRGRGGMLRKAFFPFYFSTSTERRKLGPERKLHNLSTVFPTQRSQYVEKYAQGLPNTIQHRDFSKLISTKCLRKNYYTYNSNSIYSQIAIKGTVSRELRIQRMNGPTILDGLHNSRCGNHDSWAHFFYQSTS